MLPVRASLTQRPGRRHVVELEALGPDELLGGRRRALIRVSTFSWPMPRRGSAFVELDELADGVLAVAVDAGRDALGDRRDLAADDQAAVVVAGDVGLDDDVAARGSRASAPGRPPGRRPPSAGRGGRRGRGCRRAA